MLEKTKSDSRVPTPTGESLGNLNKQEEKKRLKREKEARSKAELVFIGHESETVRKLLCDRILELLKVREDKFSKEALDLNRTTSLEKPNSPSGGEKQFNEG